MAYDANMVLRGAIDGVYEDLDNGDLAATTIKQNTDGNYVVDLGDHGTPMAGLDCVIILHDQCTDYTHYADFVIEDSDHLGDGWQSLLTFPRVYAYMRELTVISTTAYVATDIGQVCDGTTSSDVGVIREFSRKLLTLGATGKIFVEMQGVGDAYDSPGESLTTTGGAGAGTLVGVGRVPNWSSGGLTIVRRFSTPKRYIRLGADAPNNGNFGDVDILVTGSQHGHINNLYR